MFEQIFSLFFSTGAILVTTGLGANGTKVPTELLNFEYEAIKNNELLQSYPLESMSKSLYLLVLLNKLYGRKEVE